MPAGQGGRAAALTVVSTIVCGARWASRSESCCDRGLPPTIDIGARVISVRNDGVVMSAEVTVRIPEALRQFAGGSRELRIAASSVEELMTGTTAAGYGALVNHICARDGQLRPFVNVYVGDASIRALDGLRTNLKAGDVVTILPSVAGG
jgi:molybdopterin synthase sulfur carrier subunit